MSSIWNDFKWQYRSGDVTFRLVVWNILLYAVPAIVFGLLQLFGIGVNYLKYVSLSSQVSDLLWKPHSLISYAFFHAGFFHILFNMVMLYFSGRLFLTFFTTRQLLGLYVLGGVFAGFLYMVSYAVFPMLSGTRSSLVGASGAVMAVLFATVSYAPMMSVRLFLFGNVKLWHIAAVVLLLDLINLTVSNTGGHIAHIGGAAFGVLYIWMLKNTDMDPATRLAGWMYWPFEKRDKPAFKKVHRNYKAKPQTQTGPGPRVVTKSRTQQQIDEILDKISRSGYESLSAEEKEFLFRAGKN